jgi:hypothetical protein
MLKMRKEGKLAWEVIAVIVLALAVLVVMTLFSTTIRDRILAGWKELLSVFTGRSP